VGELMSRCCNYKFLSKTSEVSLSAHVLNLDCRSNALEFKEKV